LLQAGHSVDVVDDLSTGSLENLSTARAGGSGLDFFEMDVRDPQLEALMASKRPEVVIHLAAQISVAASLRDPVHDAEVNVAGTLSVLEAARSVGARKLLFATSAAIYGDVDEADLPITEQQPRRPRSPYGISKAAALRYLEIAEDIEWSALALANVYGPRQSLAGEAGVVALFADHLRRGTRPTIYGDGEQQRDFLFVDDAAEAFMKAITAGSGRLFNIGTGIGSSVNALWDELAKAARGDLRPIYEPGRAGDIRTSRLDSTLASAILGWSATTSLPAGLAQLIERQG
jgi:UDP-glucose 4-epimerase